MKREAAINVLGNTEIKKGKQKRRYSEKKKQKNIAIRHDNSMWTNPHSDRKPKYTGRSLVAT